LLIILSLPSSYIAKLLKCALQSCIGECNCLNLRDLQLHTKNIVIIESYWYNGQTFTNRHINCNETADGFFCKSGIAILSYTNLTLHVLMIACKTSKLRIRAKINKTQ
jgi:hypothetical protein